MTDPEVPLLRAKHYDDPSAFTPQNLLREARRQKGLADIAVPRVCLLDPDGDIAANLQRSGRAESHPGWACYHTTMWVFDLDGREIGVVPCAVGSSFAVLVAEQLFASGCELLISVTSSGQVVPAGEPPYFVLIDRALRDEGTSYHYLPPSQWSHLDHHLAAQLDGAFDDIAAEVHRGAAWTTDAPFRETDAAIASAAADNILAVEMEAAALYAFATARHRNVVCVAHVTNTMAIDGDDFEKGEADGSRHALEVVAAIASVLLPQVPDS